MSAQAAKSVFRVSSASNSSKGFLGTSNGWLCQSSSNASSSAEGEKTRTPTMNRKEALNLAALKRGPGYRSSFSGVVATVFGASGMVGRSVCSRLGKSGTQIIVPYRGDHYHVLRLKVTGDLGQVLYSPFHLRDEESIRNAMKYSDVVINLIGREFVTRNFTFEDVNVTGPALIAKVAREEGIKRLVHISSINARENPQKLFLPGNGSEWLRTKWLGERAVLDQFPDATIFRPADMFGTNDHFVHYYNSWYRKSLDIRNMALWKRGEETVKAPLFVNDLATAILAALDDPSSKGMIYEAMGPERFLLSDLVDWMHEIMSKVPEDYFRKDLRFAPVTFAKAIFASNMPMGMKKFKATTLERLERSQLTDESEGLPSITELGVQLHTVGDKMPWELQMFNQDRVHYFASLEDKRVVNPLVPLSKYDERQIIERKSIARSLSAAIGL